MRSSTSWVLHLLPFFLSFFLPPFLRKKVGKIAQFWCYDSEILHEASLDTFIKIQGEPNCLHVCQSVSWHTSLLKLDIYRNIYSSGWDIFLKSFGDICGIFVDFFWIIPNFLYVCQSVSWLTYLLNEANVGIYLVLDQISYWNFSRHSWDVGTLVSNNSEFLVCPSVC